MRRCFRSILTLWLLLRLAVFLNAQDSQPLQKLIPKIETHYNVKLFYKNDWINLYLDNEVNWSEVISGVERPILWQKEKVIYPKQPTTLTPIELSPENFVLSKPTSEDSGVEVDVDIVKKLNRFQLHKQISESYGITKVLSRNKAHQIPYDAEFKMENYVSFPTMEEFISEIIPHIKIKKIRVP